MRLELLSPVADLDRLDFWLGVERRVIQTFSDHDFKSRQGILSHMEGSLRYLLNKIQGPALREREEILVELLSAVRGGFQDANKTVRHTTLQVFLKWLPFLDSRRTEVAEQFADDLKGLLEDSFWPTRQWAVAALFQIYPYRSPESQQVFQQEEALGLVERGFQDSNEIARWRGGDPVVCYWSIFSAKDWERLVTLLTSLMTTAPTTMRDLKRPLRETIIPQLHAAGRSDLADPLSAKLSI